jgi:choline kinase
MKAIILAAGKGSRLRGLAGDRPKCLARVGDHTLIERQIRALRESGIEEIVAVVGYRAEIVRSVCGPDIEYVENPIFFRTNSLYSLWLASHRLGNGFVVLNSDVLFHPQLLTDLLTTRYEDALLISYKDQTGATLGDEEMKVKVRAGAVMDISKAIDPVEADGENVGIAKFGPGGAALLTRQMAQLIAKGNYRAWAPRAFREFAQSRALHVIGTRGFPWIEIDFPEDYQRAINHILPEIEAYEPSFDPNARLLAAVAAGDRV